jgi:hypothetical protein
MFNLIAMFSENTSNLPPWSAILFIVGAAFFILSTLYGWFREPWAWDRGIGYGLMILGIGLKVVFGM